MSSNNDPPAIPDDIDEDEVLAIDTIHHDRAHGSNEDGPHAIRTILPGSAVSGIHVFLRQVNGTPNFTIGRQISEVRLLRGVRAQHDIFLPDNAVGMRQCVLQPVPEQNLWRVHSTSKIIATVNGTPIQDCKPTSNQQPNSLPKAIYLKQYDHVSGRSELWARNRYYITGVQVSEKTFRVINRFTGIIETAKVFERGQNPRRLRDKELLLMGKAEVDASIVRYQQSTEIGNIPAIITDTYDGFDTYESLRDDIRRSHPGWGFEVASQLVRGLFSALAWMHFNDIIHGNVSNGSVLLRIVNRKCDQVLLVDYSTARPFVTGEMLPLEEMIADGQAAMQLIEDFCDIWALRNGAPATTTAENVMRQRTQELMDKHEAVKRVFDDYIRKGNNVTDSKGKKLAKLQDKLKNSWKSAHDKETHNRASREIVNMSRSKTDAMVREWELAHPPQLSIYKQHMLLSLGHPYIDSLANNLYVIRWDTTPHEICGKLRTVGGDIEEP
ncbi:hypothetical protein DE146DRAFT_768415 [Phaeosphaeria sp. MPI-PUGE-AT-0046c]|nr:hypothetical protein DE146DRAFT_768415 [Phaeosphaeria sp. MPI-PUGE-AT-0046c]